jgi:hypothetical protein
MSSNDPGPLALIEAACVVLRTTTTAGEVVPDPVYTEEYAEYAAMLTAGAPSAVNGWLVGIAQEEPEARSSDHGGEYFTRLFCTAMYAVRADEEGCPSRAEMNQKIVDAKQAFRDSPDLGLTATKVKVRHERLYSPQGYVSAQFKEYVVHVAPCELRVWVWFC